MTQAPFGFPSVALALLAGLAALGALALLSALATTSSADNQTPETAAPLADHTNLQEYLNASDGTKQYWYKMNISRGDELFIYFYGTGELYHRTRMFYSMLGPDSYADAAFVHGEYWYDHRDDWYDDYWDLWDWLCPVGGTYYFHFYALYGAVGDFYCNIMHDTPKVTYRSAHETGTVWWYDVNNLKKYDTWRIWLEAQPDTVQGVEVKLTWTGDKYLDVEAFDLADRYEANLLNGSYSIGYDKTEVIKFTASYTGWYYIRVNYNTWWDTENYELWMTLYSAPNDGDNTPDNATLVRKAGTFSGTIEASRDMHDWYRFDLDKGDLLGVSMSFFDPDNPRSNPGGHYFNNHYEIQVYDQYMQRIYPHGYGYSQDVWQDYPQDVINNMPLQPSDVQFTGMYYLRVSFSSSTGPSLDPTNTSHHIIAYCKYDLQITIPNKPPRINASALEDVLMLEDTTWWEDTHGVNHSYLDLARAFYDPEGGDLTFTATSDPNVTAKVTAGRLTLRPAADWFGDANVTITAKDDSGNRVSALLHITVAPVNDAPRVAPGPFQIPFLEDDPSVKNRTLNMYDIFYDIDPGDGHNLTFAMAPDAHIIALIDNRTGDVTLVPAPDFNGEVDLTFYATDPHGARTAVTVKAIVAPVNDAPRARANGTTVINLKEGFMMTTFDAASLLYDPDSDANLRWYVHYVDPADKGNLTITNEAKDPLNSVIVVMPATGKNDWFGTVRITIECVDPGRLSGSKAVVIVVENTPDPPVIVSVRPVAGPTFPEGTLYAFTVTEVQDPDPGEGNYTYAWTLKPQGGVAREVQNSSRNTYEMDTDYKSAGVYTLTVTVYDETGLPSPNPAEWVVTVTNTNRKPSVTITSPADNASVKQGTWVELKAAGTDPDEEDQSGLTYEWYEGPRLLGAGATMAIKDLSPGDHLITAVVKDPGGAVGEQTITVKIKRAAKSPGAGALASALAIAAAAGLSAISGRPRHGPPARDGGKGKLY
jgi:hypothetical protein